MMKKIEGLKLMYLLEYLENSFDSLNIRVKIELFLFPLIVFLLLWFLFFKDKPKKENILLNNTLTNNIKMKDSFTSIIENIQKFCEENNILIKMIENQGQSIKLKIETSLKKQIKVIKFIEDYNSFSKISSLRIDKNSLFLEIVFNKLYVKNKFNLDIETNKLFKNSKIYKLSAIIDNKAYINNRWFTLNENLDSYKLIDIDRNSVLLQNEYEKVRLFINEDI